MMIHSAAPDPHLTPEGLQRAEEVRRQAVQARRDALRRRSDEARRFAEGGGSRLLPPPRVGLVSPASGGGISRSSAATALEPPQPVEESRHAHPSGHRFFPRSSFATPGGSQRSLGRGTAIAAAVAVEEELQHRGEEQWLPMVEPESSMERWMLSEVLQAMRQSAEGAEVSLFGGGSGSGDGNAEAEDPELRAAIVLSRLFRSPWGKAQAGQEDRDQECSLCLEEYGEDEEVLTLRCGHIFHEHCLGPWLVRSLLCPICKRDLVESADETADELP